MPPKARIRIWLRGSRLLAAPVTKLDGTEVDEVPVAVGTVLGGS